MKNSKLSNTFFTATTKGLLVMALAILAVGCGEKDSPSGKHQVTAVIQIHHTKPNFHTTNESFISNEIATLNENFIANEIASLSLGVNLTAAALMGNWESQDIDPNNIQKNLVVTHISGTDMARITLHSDDPDQAKNIIEALIESYLVTRKKNEEGHAKRALAALDNEKRELSDLVQDYRKELTVLIQQYGIPYFDDGGSGNHLGLTEQAMFRSSREELAKLENEGDLLRAKYEALERDKIEQAKLTPQLEVLERQVLKMREMVDARHKDAITLSLKQTNYTQAKEQYERAREILREMKKQHSEAVILLKIPRDLITVRQEPKMAESTNKNEELISSKYFDSKSGEANPKKSKPPIEAGRRDPMEQQVVNGTRDKIKKNFQGFMKLPEKMKGQFIDRSADLSLTFSDFYEKNSFPPVSGKLTQTGVNVLKLPGNELAVESIWRDSEGYQWGAVHILDRTTSRWKLDWENFAPYSTESWSKFINRLDGSSNEGTFRVLVTKRRTTDDGKKISLNFYRAPHIKEDDGEFKKSESPEIDLLAGSDLAKEFMQLWKDHQEENDPMGSILGRAIDPEPRTYMRITVRLGWEDNKRDKEVLELKGIIGAGWFGERIIKLRKSAKDADTLAGRPVIDRERADSWFDDIEKANRNTKKNEEGEIAAKDADDFEKFDESKMEEVVKNFVTAESPAELKKYIRNSERVGPLLDRYYERADYEAEGFEALDMSQMKYNGDVVTMLVQKADFLSSPIAVERVVDGEEESYQIDWESWVGYCDYTPEQMRAEKPDKPFLMRVIVKPTNYYNYDFSDDVKWRSLGLELKDSIDSFIGYVERDSEQDKKFRVMMKGGQVVACMVRVAYPTGSRSKDQVEILEIVGSGWLQNLKKDK